jgi:hypothetical protein
MSSIAVAALIQREVGLDAVVQITTARPQRPGLQSDLLGAGGPRVKASCVSAAIRSRSATTRRPSRSRGDVLGLLRMARA